MSLQVDGFTPQGLSSASSWWDESFTRLLFDAIPADTLTLCELECGTRPGGVPAALVVS